MSSDLDRLLIAGVLVLAALALLFWPQPDGSRDWHKGVRHPALWVLLSLAVSFAATALLAAHSVVVLGLTPSTTREEVLDAYRHMLWFANPDHGGSDWLIETLNEARDVLLKR
jgi:hypothetical protein